MLFKQHIVIILGIIKYLCREKFPSKKKNSDRLIQQSVVRMNSSFEDTFFQYEAPVPWVSGYTEEMIRNNDLKLMLQICTQSHLRLNTNIQTFELHFTCKKYRAQCFDITAMQSKQDKLYYVECQYQTFKHKYGCELKEQAAKFLQIYNLLKLKKNYIEALMNQHHLNQSSPAQILTFISGGSTYFFEKYIKKNIEMRKKLMKRFDNIVNIDIKAVTAKNDDQKSIDYDQHFKKAANKQNKIEIKEIYQKPPFKRSTQIRSIEKNKIKKSKKQKKNQNIFERESSQEESQSSESHIKDLIFQERQIDFEQEKDLNMQKIEDKINPMKILCSLTENQQNTTQQQNLKISNAEPQIQSNSEKQQLEEIQILNEEYEMNEIFSHSECESEYQGEMILNREDYFKSLRNSTLKQSLEKQSLSSANIFAIDTFMGMLTLPTREIKPFSVNIEKLQ